MIKPIDFFLKIEQTINSLSMDYNIDNFNQDDFYTLFGTVKKLFEDSCYNFTIESGWSKAVIIPAEGNFVFKIPLMFDVNNYNCLTANYCDEEVSQYKEAKIEGLEYAFVKTVPFDEMKIKYGAPLPFYIQDKVEVFDKWGKCDKIYDEMSEKYENTLRLPSLWIEDFCNAYGVESFEDFGIFVCNSGINDLHSGNVGYLDGMPVVFDYSGYFESNEDYNSDYCDF